MLINKRIFLKKRILKWVFKIYFLNNSIINCYDGRKIYLFIHILWPFIYYIIFFCEQEVFTFICMYLGKSSWERRSWRNCQWPEYICNGYMSGIQSRHCGKFQKSTYIDIFYRVFADIIVIFSTGESQTSDHQTDRCGNVCR